MAVSCARVRCVAGGRSRVGCRRNRASSGCRWGGLFFQAEDGIRDVAVDWSSDVCSSDLLVTLPWESKVSVGAVLFAEENELELCTDRKSVVEGKSVDLGGRRIIKKIK